MSDRSSLFHRIKSYVTSAYTVALTLGLLGGAIFAYMGAPLAWLLGAMAFTTLAAFAGFNVAVWPPLRTVMIMILGVMLGSAFTPDLVGQLPGWAAAILMLMGALAILTTVAFAFLRYVAKYDPVTSYFSATPGGLSEMVIVGEASGGDVKTISLTHATRILVVVSVIPIYFRLVMGLEVPPQPANAVSFMGYDAMEGLILIMCAAIGFPVAKLIHAPAPALLGPAFFSSLAHISGVSHVPPPIELIAIAQVVIGTAIGSRFAGITLGEVWRTMLMAASVALVMIGVAVLLAPFFAPVVGISVAAMFLALVPGGLMEMSLIALSLGIDTAFISTMHILRIVMIIAIAPLAFRGLGLKVS